MRSNIDKSVLNCERRMSLPRSAESEDSERVTSDNSGMGGESERGVEGTEVGRLGSIVGAVRACRSLK